MTGAAGEEAPAAQRTWVTRPYTPATPAVPAAACATAAAAASVGGGRSWAAPGGGGAVGPAAARGGGRGGARSAGAESSADGGAARDNGTEEGQKFKTLWDEVVKLRAQTDHLEQALPNPDSHPTLTRPLPQP